MMNLLLSPGQLLKGCPLELLQISRTGNRVDYRISGIEPRSVQQAFPGLEENARKSLLRFAEKNLREIRSLVRQAHASKGEEAAVEALFMRHYLKEVHGLFTQLRSFSARLKWFHRVPLDAGRFRTSPCRFSLCRPRLSFELMREEGGLGLRALLSFPEAKGDGLPWTDAALPLEEFRRHQFLLERNDVYFLLAQRDFQVLNWLEENPPAAYASDPAAFSSQVLARLEESHTVDRKGLLGEEIIETLPENRLMLSELNGQFLLFTPQWTYDNLLVEGPFQELCKIQKGGRVYLVKRNREAEESFLHMLRELHPTFRQQHNGFFFLSFAEASKSQWFLKSYHFLLDRQIELVGMDMLQHFRYSPHKAETRQRILPGEGAWLKLQMQVSFGKETVSLASLQKTLLAGQKAVLLKGNTLGILDEVWLRRYGNLLRHGKLSGDCLEVPRWMALAEPEDEAGPLKQSLKAQWWEKWAHWQQKDEALFPLPTALQGASLRPYQQKGYEWLILLAEAGAGACLADDMGLGKTLQTIAFLLNRLEESPGLPHLVLCPASLIYNWQQELQKFAPSLSCLVYHGAKRNPADLEESGAQVFVTSFGTFRSDAELLSSISFNTVVIDESHHIKNPDTQLARTVSRLQASHRVALSGTPVMNNTFDLYSQLDFLVPGMFGSREFFRKQYADAIDRDQDEEKIKALRKLTAPFILRRTKEQVAPELPGRNEIVMWCDMGPAQRLQYEEIRQITRSNLLEGIRKEGLQKSRLAVLQGITRLRQVCNSPLLLPPEERSCSDSVKTEMLMDELCNGLKEQKVLVFSQFSSMLDLLAESCRRQGIAYYHFDGSTPGHQRMEMVNSFQEEGNTVNVFLISLMAGNAGLNLTAASYVFLFDPWWNTAVQQQAIDRTHRIGQTKTVFAYKMICRDSIEEKILRMQQEKKQLAEDLIRAGEGFVQQLSMEDIEYLFE